LLTHDKLPLKGVWVKLDISNLELFGIHIEYVKYCQPSELFYSLNLPLSLQVMRSVMWSSATAEPVVKFLIMNIVKGASKV